MIRSMRLESVVGLGLAVFLFLTGSGFGAPLVVREVQVRNLGAGVLDEGTVLAHVGTKAGDLFSRVQISRDVRSLQECGLFSFVEASVKEVPRGVAVIFSVKRRPRIRSLKIEGADHLGNRKVRKLMEIGAGDLVDDTVMAAAARKVREEYRKRLFPDVRVKWTIKEDEKDAVADVVVRVVEGQRAWVRRINFIGNHHVRRWRLLKVMKQKQASIFSWLTRVGRYNPEDLAGDRAALRRYYMDQGYLDVDVSEPRVEQAGRAIEIFFDIHEGPLYKIGSIDVAGVRAFPVEKILNRVVVKTGELASYRRISESADAIRDVYGMGGYIGARVKSDLNTHPESGLVDITFHVNEGHQARVRDIIIRGNTRTKDKVIRRELAIYPGDIFNEVRVRTSERRLWNLGYFSYVNSVPQPTEKPDEYDLEFDVEEQKTGQFMVGAGFSSVDNLIGFVELSQGNFDITGWPYFTGGGQKLKLRTQFGTKRTDVELSFVEPWFLDRRLALGVNFFRHDRRFLSDDYDQKNTGGSLSLTHGLGRYSRVSLEYSLEDIEVYNVANDASDVIKQEKGRRTKSAVTLSLLRDTRDSVFVPTRGNRTKLSAMLAGGPLAGDTDIYRLEARSSQYFPLWFDHVFNLRGRVSVVEEYGDSDHVPIFDRLFLGGAYDVRGFHYRDVGPKDQDGEPVGGKTAAYMTAEYTVPLAEKVRAAVFYDMGMVSESAYSMDGDLNSSAGLGLRLNIPGFPLRLDYAWPIETDEYNKQPSGRFSFVIGYSY